MVLIEDPGRPGDPLHEILSANVMALRGQTDAKGRPIELVTVRAASEADCDSDRFCRSYVNSYLVNGGVAMPLYGTPSDEVAEAVFRRLFPDHRIAGVPIGHIAIGGGGIHCITQQQPAARKDRTG